jgi:predicted nucleic-acid-binding protein
MIGLDINGLARYIMQDDLKQSRQATALIESMAEDAPGFVALVASAQRRFSEGNADFAD